MKIGDKTVVKIYDQENFGRGIAKIEDKIIFVENALPNEVVEVLITQDKHTFYVGEVVQMIEKSENRMEYECPYYPECGGCQIGHQAYEGQLQFKQKKVENVLGTLVDKSKIKGIVSSDTRGYRNKGTFKIRNNKIGFYEEKTNHIVSINNCLLMDGFINKGLNIIHNYLKDSTLSDSEITIRSNGEKILIHSDVMLPDPLVQLLKMESYVYGLVCKDKVMFGDSYFSMNLGSLVFEVSPESFFQVNNEIAQKLYQYVRESAELNKTETVLDLYCGVGTIGLYLADQAKEMIGVELVEKAVINAKNNSLLNHIDNAKFLAGDVFKEVKKVKKQIDVLVVDPPRSGLGGSVKHILDMKPGKVIYVSCDLHTLKRDLKILMEDYQIEQVTPFDMFPNTYHVETVVLLSRKL